uniref:FAD dependent oxidoreductase domain-containing protein n=1 Tax=Gossypium raimondii TaxID=29730 RepID=A0A0D2PJ32_GOSRA|nr:hypothetical protein B456_001G195300 [Gossypium raimondii]
MDSVKTVITHEPQLISITVYDTDRDRMQNTVAKVAVVGSGISGSVCAATLARNGISVTLFDSAKGPGGRMSQRSSLFDTLEILKSGERLAASEVGLLATVGVTMVKA